MFTYVPPSEIEYEINFGMTLKDYRAAWHKKYADGKVEFGFNSVAGYTTGPRAREDAFDGDQPRSARIAPGDVQPVGQTQDARRHVRARSEPAARSAK